MFAEITHLELLNIQLNQFYCKCFSSTTFFFTYPQNETVFEYPNIEFEFLTDGSYTVDGERSVGIYSNGKWAIDNNIVDFYDLEFEVLNSQGLVSYMKYTWDIIDLTEDSLKVLHNYVAEPFMGPGSQDSIRLTFYREFVRIQ